MTRREPSHTIVVGIDGSLESLAAARFAATLAASFDAKVVAVHAVGLLDVWPAPTTSSSTHLRNSHTEVTAHAKGAWSEPLRTAGVNHEVILRDGPPPLVVIDVADEHDADMIVVGTRGTGAADLTELGSTAARIIQRSHRPVTVVPHETCCLTDGVEYRRDTSKVRFRHDPPGGESES